MTIIRHTFACDFEALCVFAGARWWAYRRRDKSAEPVYIYLFVVATARGDRDRVDT